MIGDSVADAMEHSPHALESLNNGYSVRLQTRGCRRLRSPSCTIAGSNGPPQTALQVVNRLGAALGQTVVVDVGYNDTPQHYNRDLNAVMRALKRVGVQTVVWPRCVTRTATTRHPTKTSRPGCRNGRN